MGHNKMFAAYSEYTIGSRPEAALIQHNSRCGVGVAAAVAVSGSVEPPCPPTTRPALARSHLHLTTKAAPPFLTICLVCRRYGMARAAGRLCPTKRDARGKGFQIWLNVTAFDACIHARPGRGRQEARREARRSYYLFKMKAPGSWDIIRLRLNNL